MLALVPLVAASSDRYTVYALIALLVLVGLGMVGVTVWLVKVTRPEHESLSALEVMSSRRFRREGTRARQRRLAGAHATVTTERAGGAPGIAADAAPGCGELPGQPADPDVTEAVPRIEPWDDTVVDAGHDRDEDDIDEDEGDEDDESSTDDAQQPADERDGPADEAGGPADEPDDARPAAGAGGTIA